nr:ATP-binding protein [Lysobacter enzymogenes]
MRALVRPDPQRAEATLDALVGYLRATIPKLREGEARLDAELGQQLDICASYLEVMRLRTDGRLSHAVQAPAAVRLLPCPPLLLIPLVENAVKHGIEPRSGPGRIELRARRDGDWLELEVADDGVGLRTGVGGGVGLANVRAQLAARFGERATLQLCSRREGGTLAQVRLPLERPA